MPLFIKLLQPRDLDKMRILESFCSSSRFMMEVAQSAKTPCSSALSASSGGSSCIMVSRMSCTEMVGRGF